MSNVLECQCCKSDRAQAGRPARQKVKLPISRATKLKKLAVNVCPHCDGPVATMHKRSG